VARGRAGLAAVLLSASLAPAPGYAGEPARERSVAKLSPAAGLHPEVVQAVRELLQDEMSRLGIPGLSIAVARHGELRHAEGFGWADVENELPATADTVYRLASVGKPMTAVAALQLAERGLLDLDAPAWRYCPRYPSKPWPLSARQLLCHQAGVRHYHPGEQVQYRRYDSVAEGLALFQDDPLVFEPGTAVQYTTFGYCLLGCVVEGAAGKPFLEVLREQVFAPAGMTATQPDDSRLLIPRRAAGYRRSYAGELLNSGMTDTSYKVPGGGLCGSAPDVARFGAALLTEKLISGDSLKAMLTGQKIRSGRRTGFGLGVTVGERNGRREAWHTGGQERVSTVLYLGPESGVVVAVLSNLEGAQPPLLAVARRVADLVTAEQVLR
jgi:CubicO group peptidase (beta-lactamase class C family)